MSTKKRWIITIIVVLALACVIGIGITLHHSSDRVLRATDGTEAAAEDIGDSQVPEMSEEAGPSEETVDLALPAPEETTETPPEEMIENEEAAPDIIEEGESSDVETFEDAQEAVSYILPDEPGMEMDEETSVEENGSGPEEEDVSDEEPVEEETDEEPEEEAGEAELRAEAADGARIIVRKQNGTFPAGAYVRVMLVSDESTQTAVEEALDGNTQLVDIISYDITILDKDGNEIIPDSDVQISILGASVEEGQEVSVYHIEENGEAEKVMDVQDPAQISFDALPG
ncbi:MAG: hypothetical protein IKE31_12700 [Eubacterium sp.]|nr:hypothetical protein [Eubacterium sp.]